MSVMTVCIFLFVIGIVLMLGEFSLPAHGMLGAMGGICIACGIGAAFYVNVWIGAGLLVGTLAAIPAFAALAVTVWPRTPMGRRIILAPLESTTHPPRVGVGQIGTTASELRPMGWCEFADIRHEVKSEIGIIAAGKQVKVVMVDGGRLIVREI